MASMIHPLAQVATKFVGQRTRVWQFVVILDGAIIGADCNICSHCFIEGAVTIGNRVTVKNGVQLWDGLALEDDVFVGPNVTFSNDRFPVSREPPETFETTLVQTGAAIGAGATVLPGLKIGRFSMVGAGAVVVHSVPDYAIVVGNPARVVGFTPQREREC
jgi:UDP-2-acetamido-3-amino-2,3-dideoxy-glucuronate N-acetyltransferase